MKVFFNSLKIFTNNNFKIEKNGNFLFLFTESESVEIPIFSADVSIYSIFLSSLNIKRKFNIFKNSKVKIFDILKSGLKIETSFYLDENSVLNVFSKGILSDEEIEYKTFINISGKNSLATLDIKALQIGKGKANFLPAIILNNSLSNAFHSTSIQKLKEEDIFYFNNRGYTREEAKREIINSFLSNEISEVKKLFKISLF